MQDVPAPRALRIPGIGVDAELIDLGLDAEGALEVPSGEQYDSPACYHRSVTPGSVGAAVISGHVDSERAGPSVFYRLGELQPGDLVEVERVDGVVEVFRVDAVRQHAKDAFPTAEVHRHTPVPTLRLITCGGEFDRGESSYRDNIVAYATRV